MPTSDPLNRFGRIITRRDVELAVVAHMQAWVPLYIAQVEAQSGLAKHTVPVPPDRTLSYRAGLDWETWEQSWSPIYIVHVRPLGSPERQYNEGIYLQPFQIDVCLNFVMTNQATSLGSYPEDSARQYADMLGMAGCASLLQRGGLGTWPDGSTVSVKTVMETYPDTTLPYPDDRRIARSTFSCTAFVDSVLMEAGGVLTPPADPYGDVTDIALVQDITITINSVAIGDSSLATSFGGADRLLPFGFLFPNDSHHPGEPKP